MGSDARADVHKGARIEHTSRCSLPTFCKLLTFLGYRAVFTVEVLLKIVPIRSSETLYQCDSGALLTNLRNCP